jgi:DNA-binding transcriptional ArsR family regulator
LHAFEVLGDPVRRRILELLAAGDRNSGEITEVVQREFAISQPAVSQHLRVLRESGFAESRADGRRRLYCIRSGPLEEIDAWLDGLTRRLGPSAGCAGHGDRAWEAGAEGRF